VPDDEDDDALDEDDDDVPAARTPAARAAAARRTSAHEEAADDEGSDSAPMLLHLKLEHAVGAGEFTPRGEVTLNFAPVRNAAGVAGKALTFSPEQHGSKRALSAALQANPQALYRLRFVQEGQDPRDALMASVQVCALCASHFHESFTFSVDPYGQLLSVSYRTPLADCAAHATEVRAALAGKGDEFTLAPKAKISFGKPGTKAQMNVRPGFDAAGQANAQAVGSDAAPAAAPVEAEKGPDGKPVPPPQTFWQKYWMYIVPLGIYVVLQAVVAPPEQQGQSGGGAAAAPARQ